MCTMLTSFKDKDEVLLPGTDQMQQGGTFWGGARSQQIYQLGGVLHDFSGLPAASGRWIPGLPTGDGSAALVDTTMKAKGTMYFFAAMG